MCTAINETNGRHSFGRTLDLECSLGERVVITPRRFPLRFRHGRELREHYAMIGTAHLEDGVPLYYDAANEAGLCAAALNFPNMAVYLPPTSGERCLASFEVIPRVLAAAKSVEEAARFLSTARITDESFSVNLPPSPLHWIFADKSASITVEQGAGGLKIHDTPHGVLSNAPDFASQTYNLERYLHIILGKESPEGMHSRGLADFGIPGDASSGSRLVRAIFTKLRTIPVREKTAATSRLFHILDSVSQQDGLTVAEDGRAVKTVYTSVIDTAALEYCFTTYENRRIRSVRLDSSLADGEALLCYPMHSGEDILHLN